MEMSESIDSNYEQGSTFKSKDTLHDSQNEGTSSRFLSQSEEEINFNHSDTSQALSDKKGHKQGRKRVIKEKDKSKDAVSSGKDSTSTKSKGRRKKKTDQYKNQVIRDQYGVFEYDKDPEGYKKARKRQQNRESALRARDKRANKMETVESRLQKIEDKSSKMEKENMVLKAEKRQLQDQVQNLLSIITSFGANKRFKTGEKEEFVRKEESNIISTDTPDEAKNELELDFDEKDIDDSQSFTDKNNSPEETMLKLIRNNNDSIFAQEEGGFGDMLQKGLMLSLTIVMCMVMCLTGYSVSESYYIDSTQLCTTCSNPRVPFELKPIESRVKMSHLNEPHYIDQTPVSDCNFLFNLWIGVFCIMMLLTFLFKRQQYFFYNLITSPLRRSARK
ncbi:unnamed protein product [Moneuplotes crassus]|uniref:BZIP domain-containing protein n=1 Tax=Euplotes crassus TaxID=5936 RepID=A0AAD1UTZ4_EUPCR|nr:unnamed protein product [Moneuplotes crassus]